MLITHGGNFLAIQAKMAGEGFYAWSGGLLEGVGMHFFVDHEVFREGEWHAQLAYVSNPEQLGHLTTHPEIRLRRVYLLSENSLNRCGGLRLDALSEVWEVNSTIRRNGRRHHVRSIKFVLDGGQVLIWGSPVTSTSDMTRLF